MKREVIQIGHPALKEQNKSISNPKSTAIKKLIRDLKDTLKENELIGIAAPQIAENYQIFVTEARNTAFRILAKEDIFRAYINPKIVSKSSKFSVIYEGCGSVLNAQLFGPVSRSQEITIEAMDENGHTFQLTCDGILARVIQHEYDHLQGVEFLEKVHDFKKLMTNLYYIEEIKNSNEQIAASEITKIEYKKL